MAVATPLGKDVLLLESFNGYEALSSTFHFKLEMLWDVTLTPIKFENLIGKPMTITINIPGGKRYYHGLVSRFSEGAQVKGSMGQVTFVRYQAEIVPEFEFLKRSTKCRIFQQKNVPDILKQVLGGIDADWELQGSYESRDYCTQYRESDFDFASRLMEEEGIYYYFTHAASAHRMVIADTPSSHRAMPGASRIEFEPIRGGTDPQGHIYSWQKTQELRSGKVKLWDHNFELPGKNLEAKMKIADSVKAGAANHKLTAGGADKFELYDFPGAYADRFDGMDQGGGKRPEDIQKIFKDNQRTAGIRMQQEAMHAIAIHADSDTAQMTAGHKFTLDKHFAGNGDYVVKSVSHFGTQEGVYETGAGNSTYSNTFEAMPAGLPYRPSMTTNRPKVYGTVTATVTGPDGEEIFTDDYGRIKVSFPWDTDGPDDAGSSCWIRVASPWAGAQWGMIHIPRIGHEVVIAFEHGNPDYPICIGSVYNAANMPPYKLPDKRTQSGFKSRSTLKGDGETFHELRFEDKKDEEEIYFHSQKDFNRVVENNDTIKIGFEKKDPGDRKLEVYNNENITIGAGSKQGSSKTSIYVDRISTIETGDDKHQVKMGNRETKLDKGNDSLIISTGNQETKVSLGASKTEAMQSIELKVGASSIKIDQTGVTIKGINIKFEGTAMAEMTAPIAKVNGTGMCVIGGGILMIG